MSNMKNGIINVGDKITYRGSWGMDAPKETEVEAIERTLFPNSKEVDHEVDEISVDEIEYGIFYLTDGHWCYGYQIVLD